MTALPPVRALQSRFRRRVRKALLRGQAPVRPAFRQDEWSIGIYGGPDPFRLSPLPGVRNPVLTGADVTDVRADFVADPFMIRRDGEWFMFFEILNRDRRRGEIGVAASPDGRNWAYGGVVLSEPFHLSYPCVFQPHGPGPYEAYMVPETFGDGTLRLYGARRLPDEWELVGVLAEGVFVDPTVFRFDGRWWLFAETNPVRRQWDTLRLYEAEDPFGPWSEHPCSPVVAEGADRARPAGRVVRVDGRPVRFAQVCRPRYGTAVRAFEILRLESRAYEERELPGGPVLGPGADDWNSTGMHHLDLHAVAGGRWLACVDGCGRRGADATDA